MTPHDSMSHQGIRLSLGSVLVIAVVTMALGALLMYWFGNTKSQPLLRQDSALILSSHILSNNHDLQRQQQQLAEVSKTWEMLGWQHPQKLPLAYQLIAANLHVGLNEQAVYVNRRLVKELSQLKGMQHIQTIEAKQALINTLLSAHQSNMAYDLARETLQRYLEQPPQDPMLLAMAYYQNAQVNLSCVYPRCDRQEALESGLQSAEVAIRIILEQSEQRPLILGDSLMLKNWFLRDRDTKIALIEQAMVIFEERLGPYNDRTADAYVQLGKIYMHWDNDFSAAKASLEKGLSIFATLYGQDNETVGEIKRTLGDLYLDGGQFVESINYTQAFLIPILKRNRCIAAKCKQALVALLKAQLYQGDINRAEQTAQQLRDLPDDPKQPYSLSQDIEATLLRLELHLNRQKQSLFDLSNRLNLNETGGVAARNALAESVLTIELLHGLLMHYPQTLDEQKYLRILNKLVHDHSGGYVPGPERRYLGTRAMAHCLNHSSQFCQAVDKVLASGHP